MTMLDDHRMTKAAKQMCVLVVWDRLTYLRAVNELHQAGVS